LLQSSSNRGPRHALAATTPLAALLRCVETDAYANCTAAVADLRAAAATAAAAAAADVAAAASALLLRQR
jgi:hypothetical protein